MIKILVNLVIININPD